MNYDTMVRHMTSATEPGTLEDFLSLAGLDSNRALRKEVGQKVAADLREGRPLADLAGRKVWRDQNRAKPETWAKDRDIPAMTPRVPKHVRGRMFAPISRLMELSSKQPENSPRRLSEDVIDALKTVQDYDVPESDVPGWLALIHALIADRREGLSVLDALMTIKDTAATNSQLVQRLLRFDGPDTSPDGATTGSNGAGAGLH